MRRLASCGVLLLVVATTTWAQETAVAPPASTGTAPRVVAPDLPIVPATQEHSKELTAWVKEAREWQKWDQRWRGVAQWTWSGRAAERRPEPAPPAWMVQACEDFREARIIATPLLVDACQLKREI